MLPYNGIKLPVAHIVRLRQQRRNRAGRALGLRLGAGCGLALSLAAALGAVALALAYAGLTRDLPSVEILPALLDPRNGSLRQPTRLVDHSGQHTLLALENPAAAGRQAVSPGGLPVWVISATLAADDPAFCKNSGATLQGWRSNGHGTLAQKLVSDFLLWNETPGLRRALRERLLATQATQRFGCENILAWYLNSADYGRQAYGVDAAARTYFGKPATGLTLAEAALLAGLPQAPALNPLDAPQAAVEHQARVLQAMQARGSLTAEQGLAASQEALHFREALPEASGAPEFTALALRAAAAQVPLERLQRGGLTITTTLDFELQTQAACAAGSQMERLKTGGQVTPLTDFSACPAALMLPDLPAVAGVDPGLAVNVVVLDPGSGQVLALAAAGGDTAADPHRLPELAPGSILTPFVYLTAFTRGYSPASLVWDIPSAGPTANLTGSGEQSEAGLPDLLPNNDGRYHGPVRLRLALANDELAPAAQVYAQVGPENVWRTAGQFGLALSADGSGEAPAGELQSFLEPPRLNLLEISQAYGVFANQGTLTTGDETPAAAPVLALRIADASGELWWEAGSPHARPVISVQLAYLINNILSDTTARQPALGNIGSVDIGRPAALKTGRSASQPGAWAVGYTPQRVVGVWAGLLIDQAYPAAPTGQSVLPAIAAGIWRAVMQTTSRDLPAETWPTPSGVSSLIVCDPSGLLPTGDCPATVAELFLTGSEPTQLDTLYRSFQVNRETGRLATVFTPPELIEKRVFLMLPPQAAEWARLSGIPAPPTAYDVISAVEQTDPEVRIDSPQMFAYVHGRVKISGSAGGEDFALYRLQAGQGLNPQAWLQIDQDVTQPVSAGELGTWDTSGFSGVTILQLQVVSEDQHVETANVQVTVDNLAPEVKIEYPDPGQALSLPGSNGLITLLASAADDLALKSVAFFVDEAPLGTLSQPPFAARWKATRGEHILKVVAADYAGNTSESSLAFTVR